MQEADEAAMTLFVFFAVLAAAAMHAIWNALVKVHLDRFLSITLMTLGMGACGAVRAAFRRVAEGRSVALHHRLGDLPHGLPDLPDRRLQGRRFRPDLSAGARHGAAADRARRHCRGAGDAGAVRHPRHPAAVGRHAGDVVSRRRASGAAQSARGRLCARHLDLHRQLYAVRRQRRAAGGDRAELCRLAVHLRCLRRAGAVPHLPRTQGAAGAGARLEGRAVHRRAQRRRLLDRHVGDDQGADRLGGVAARDLDPVRHDDLGLRAGRKDDGLARCRRAQHCRRCRGAAGWASAVSRAPSSPGRAAPD